MRMDAIETGTLHEELGGGRDLMGNFTVEHSAPSSFVPSAASIFLAVFLAILTLTTLGGNFFVMYAIKTDAILKRVGNYLIFSLAFADFMVAVTVMPMGLYYEVMGAWTIGSNWCEMWTLMDVLCCTASILHLVAIALDRYWTVTNIDYVHKRSKNWVLSMLLVVWAVAFVVAMAPTLGWKDEQFITRVEINKECLVSQDVSYQVFATCFTFFGPLVVILFLYWRIFKVARKRIRRKPGKNVQLTEVKSTKMSKSSRSTKSTKNGTHFEQETEPVTKASTESAQSSDERPAPADSHVIGELDVEVEVEIKQSSNSIRAETPSYREILDRESESVEDRPKNAFNGSRHLTQRETLDAKRERKAAKTLAIITGVFVGCWLPFFVIALLMPLCGEKCDLPKSVFSFFLWLGYINSMLNPIIYTIFSPDFRAAFERILLGKKTPTRSPCRV